MISVIAFSTNELRPRRQPCGAADVLYKAVCGQVVVTHSLRTSQVCVLTLPLIYYSDVYMYFSKAVLRESALVFLQLVCYTNTQTTD